MDLSAIGGIGTLSAPDIQIAEPAALTGVLTGTDQKAEGTLFEAVLNSAIDNITTTNNYLSDAENEKIKFALGESKNTHDLTIAMQKASAALQYTVAVRDRFLEAYREIMQIQI